MQAINIGNGSLTNAKPFVSHARTAAGFIRHFHRGSGWLGAIVAPTRSADASVRLTGIRPREFLPGRIGAWWRRECHDKTVAFLVAAAIPSKRSQGTKVDGKTLTSGSCVAAAGRPIKRIKRPLPVRYASQHA
jgi:hypothetical protein